MKKFSLLALAAAGLLLGACASDKDEVAAVDQNVGIQYDQAFVGVSIQLPNSTTPALTRANDDLNNGEEDEFEVQNSTLLLFKGANENDATYIGAWGLSGAFDNDTQGKNAVPTTKVTSTATAVAQINDLSLLPSENLYAYVIVNHNNVTYPAVGDKLSSWKNQEFLAVKIGSQYDATNKTDDVSENGLMMTNAPVSATAGGQAASTGAVTTGVLLDKTKIAKTAAAALETPAGCIYVERSAAKVTIALSTNVNDDELNSGSKTGEDPVNTLKGTDGGIMDVEIDAFQIINTEPKYYNTRHADNVDWLGYHSEWCSNANTAYRFVSLYQFSPTKPSGEYHDVTANKRFRTYFGQDPQYDKLATLENTVATADGNWIAPTGRAFVPENTFDVEHQTRQNTTQATVRLKLNGGTSFYSITNEATLYDVDHINDAIAAKVQTLNEISTWINNVKTYLQEKLSTYTCNATIAISAAVPDISLSTTNAGDQNYTLSYTITGTKKQGEDAPVALTDEEKALSEALTTAWNNAVVNAKNDYKVNLYKGGMTYYNIRIQHFGEFETPWDKQTDVGVIKIQPGETVAQIYGYTNVAAAQTLANNRFLGRYGVVRDNWYQLTIDGIKKLGSATPVPVNLDTTPDDEIGEEFYISAHVHILPWVLRTQSVNF